MAVTIFGLIQHRRGIKTDLPPKLEEGELGFCVDTRELFIGNSSAQGGNTQILTDAADVTELISYEFLSNTQVPSQTGTSLNQPVRRTLQAHLDDAWVDVKSYGAMGDGVHDDTDSINRAIRDLYTKSLTTSENIRQARKTIYFPAGRYLVSDEILLYPDVQLQGENFQNTQIFQASHSPRKSHMLRLTDSLGQTGTNLGLNSAQLPQRQVLRDLNLYVSNAECVIRLERVNQIWFDHCVFESDWTGPTVTPGTEVAGMIIQTLGAFVYGDVWVHNCQFKNLEWGIYSTDTVRNISVMCTSFRNMYLGALLEGTPGPTYVKFSHCLFDQITQQAIKVLSTQHVHSLMNTFLNVNGSGAAIYWHSSTSLCSSVNDQFLNVPGVQDLGANNLILTAQQNNLTSARLSVSNTSLTATYYPVISGVLTGSGTMFTSSRFTLNPDPVSPLLTVQAEVKSQGWVPNYREDIVNVTVNAVQSDQIIGVAPGTTVNLPSAPSVGKMITIKDVVGTAAASNILVQPATGASIDGGTTNAPYVLNINWGSVTLIYKTGNKWLTV